MIVYLLSLAIAYLLACIVIVAWVSYERIGRTVLEIILLPIAFFYLLVTGQVGRDLWRR